jgi:hypothetical protein
VIAQRSSSSCCDRLLPQGLSALHQRLHCVNLYDYIESGQPTIIMVNLVGNNAHGASGNGPAPGYILKLVSFFELFMYYIVLILNTTTYHAITFSLIYIMNYLLKYGIKICRIKPRFLTVLALSNSQYIMVRMILHSVVHQSHFVQLTNTT